MFHLENLDNGRFDDLPEPVYVAGFIKGYSDCVGLNGETLSEQYRQEADPNYSNEGSRAKSAANVILPQEYLSKGKLDTAPPTFKTFYFNAIGIIVVLGLVSYIGMTQVSNFRGGQNEPSYGSLKDSAAVLNKVNSPVAETKPTIVAAGSNQISLVSNKHVWVEVKSAATDETFFIGYLEQGDHKDFETPSGGLRIRVSDAGAVSISQQGKTTSFGEPGRELERVVAAGKSGGAEQPVTSADTGSRTAGGLAPGATPGANAGTAPAGGAVSVATSAAPAPPARKTVVSKLPRPRRALDQNGSQAVPESHDVPYKYGEGRLDAD